MSDLLVVADGAYPQDDYSFLPAEVVAWGGYVGGATEHDWTAEEVADLEATGRAWWGIWTAPQGEALLAAQAQADAAAMLAGLAELGRPKSLPVLYDIEHDVWAADPHTTTQSAQLWCRIMNASGYPTALWYGPCQSVASWRACWTGAAPRSIPAGALGVQYAGNALDGRADLSVFDPALLPAAAPAPGIPLIPSEDEQMYMVIQRADGSAWLLWGTSVSYGLHSGTDVSALHAAGVPVVTVSDQLASEMLAGRTHQG